MSQSNADLFGHETVLSRREPAHADAVRRAFRALADGEPTREVMEILYHEFGDSCGLRPPVAELNLARKCETRSDSRG